MVRKQPPAEQPPAKRVRLSTAAAYDDVPGIEEQRRLNQLKLQGRFGAIFEKYERDFTGIGDEIDLETMEVVVDNGHLRGMKHELDTTNRTKRGNAAARREVPVNNDHDELSSPTHAKQEDPPQQVFDTLEPQHSDLPDGLAGQVATVIGGQNMAFNPFDPVSVAELGKSIAVNLAQQLMQRPFPQAMSNPRPNSPNGVNPQILTPPASDIGIESPFNRVSIPKLGMKRTRSTDEAATDRSPDIQVLPSIWGGGRGLSLEPLHNEDAELMQHAETTPHAKKRALGYNHWSPEDDTRLIQLSRDKNLSWDARASHFPNRNKRSLQNRLSNLAKAKQAPAQAVEVVIVPPPLRAYRQPPRKPDLPILGAETSKRPVRDMNPSRLAIDTTRPLRSLGRMSTAVEEQVEVPLTGRKRGRPRKARPGFSKSTSESHPTTRSSRSGKNGHDSLGEVGIAISVPERPASSRLRSREGLQPIGAEVQRSLLSATHNGQALEVEKTGQLEKSSTDRDPVSKKSNRSKKLPSVLIPSKAAGYSSEPAIVTASPKRPERLKKAAVPASAKKTQSIVPVDEDLGSDDELG